MSNKHIIPATITTFLITVSAFGSAGPASAGGFGPTIPGLDDPVIDTPTFPGACDDKKSPTFGWCLPDFVTGFDPISPTQGPDGSGFVAVQIRNIGTGTKEALWSTIRVEGSDLVRVTNVDGGDALFDVQQSWFDTSIYFVEIPDGLAKGDYAYIGLRFADAHDIDVEVEANFHSESEVYDFAGLGDYRIDERTYLNNVGSY